MEYEVEGGECGDDESGGDEVEEGCVIVLQIAVLTLLMKERHLFKDSTYIQITNINHKHIS